MIYLPTTKMQNIYLLINILRIIFTLHIGVPFIPAWARIAQHNTINYVHFLNVCPSALSRWRFGMDVSVHQRRW